MTSETDEQFVERISREVYPGFDGWRTVSMMDHSLDRLFDLARRGAERWLVPELSQTVLNQTDRIEQLEAALRDYAKDDHERGCSGRYYDCHCGYDDKRDQLIDEAAAEIDHLRHLLRINTEQQSEHIRTLIESWEKERSILTDQIKNLRHRVEHAEWLVDKYRQDE